MGGGGGDGDGGGRIAVMVRNTSSVVGGRGKYLIRPDLFFFFLPSLFLSLELKNLIYYC